MRTDRDGALLPYTVHKNGGTYTVYAYKHTHACVLDLHCDSSSTTFSRFGVLDVAVLRLDDTFTRKTS